jgi:hypothetical protein
MGININLSTLDKPRGAPRRYVWLNVSTYGNGAGKSLGSFKMRVDARDIGTSYEHEAILAALAGALERRSGARVWGLRGAGYAADGSSHTYSTTLTGPRDRHSRGDAIRGEVWAVVFK